MTLRRSCMMFGLWFSKWQRLRGKMRSATRECLYTLILPSDGSASVWCPSHAAAVFHKVVEPFLYITRFWWILHWSVSGRDHDQFECTSQHSGCSKSSIWKVQPTSHSGAEHSTSCSPSVSFRSVMAHTRQTRSRQWPATRPTHNLCAPAL